jgi:spoIIIJ-associated protein
VEWIEVSARTLEDATELALDRLGVVASELEYEVIEEPRSGLFGIGRTEARIRARVKPLSREKPPDRRRRRSSERRPSGGRKPRGDGGAARTSERAAAPAGGSGDGEAGSGSARQGSSSGTRRRRRGGRGGSRSGGAGAGGEQKQNQDREQQAEANVNGETDAEDIDVGAQAERAERFMGELVEAMGLAGNVSSRIDDGTILLDVEGEGLGLLVGPRGSTLQAVEELTRAVVQHGLTGRSARLRVDIGGYKERRREALAAFARQVAEEVRDNGRERALEPMAPPDRKVVHDTIAEMDGVETGSEGEEPRRRVVIRPA